MNASATPTPPPEATLPPGRDADAWARRVERLSVGDLPARARNLNVDGRRVTSPIQGFGKLWQKTYRIRLEGADVTPEDVVAVWRSRFAEFWPQRNWFFGSLDGIKPGDVAVLNLSMLGMPVSTGVLVLYADDTTFTVMTPEGHQFAGFNTFSAHRDGDVTCIQIQALIRASDPVYELALPLVGHRIEDRFWDHTLRALAAEFGVSDQDVALERVLVDKRRQWRRWANVWSNAAIRSILWLLATPFRLMVKPFRSREVSMGAQQMGQAAPPQAPVVVIGRQTRFLDVQQTVAEAEDHLARHGQADSEHGELPPALPVDACDYYDGIARPLNPVTHADGTVTLELTVSEPEPQALRAKVNDLLRWAHDRYAPDDLPPTCQVGEDKLQPVPDEYSFARFLTEVELRFNPPPAAITPYHSAGRLHNLWHALGG